MSLSIRYCEILEAELHSVWAVLCIVSSSRGNSNTRHRHVHQSDKQVAFIGCAIIIARVLTTSTAKAA